MQQLGIYKISKKIIAIELNMDSERLEKAIDNLENNNINIVGEYIDRAKSGTKDNRDNFLKWLKIVKIKRLRVF